MIDNKNKPARGWVTYAIGTVITAALGYATILGYAIYNFTAELIPEKIEKTSKTIKKNDEITSTYTNQENSYPYDDSPINNYSNTKTPNKSSKPTQEKKKEKSNTIPRANMRTKTEFNKLSKNNENKTSIAINNYVTAINDYARSISSKEAEHLENYKALENLNTDYLFYSPKWKHFKKVNNVNNSRQGDTITFFNFPIDIYRVNLIDQSTGTLLKRSKPDLNNITKIISAEKDRIQEYKHKIVTFDERYHSTSDRYELNNLRFEIADITEEVIFDHERGKDKLESELERFSYNYDQNVNRIVDEALQVTPTFISKRISKHRRDNYINPAQNNILQKNKGSGANSPFVTM